jgi:hypothetical protein
MLLKLFSLSTLMTAFLLPGAQGFAASDTEQITIHQDLQIPGNILKPGAYTFAVEDRMLDRAIIRISSAKAGQNFLLLAVPNPQISARSTKGILLFDSGSPEKRILRGWSCPDCSTPLELAYPKLEAIKITGETGQSVLAVDPASDKLPLNLSPDDMKVVTLWLLSPKRIGADHRGIGLNAVKYASLARTHGRHLPQTASNTYLLVLCGALSLALSWALRGTGKRKSA